MLALTPTVIRTHRTSWTTGWLAILLGCVVVLMLLVVVDRLTAAPDQPEPNDVPAARSGSPDRFS
ncbi:hypothetical protein ACFXB4_19520 [Streptomyces lavendulae]|uniref:hypothetical protein n=1 Tax=Streptomyces lavendulae TaxID=1914 RepID=UPI00367B3AAB